MEHRVWFTRYGVRHYYPAPTREDADRWIRVYQEIGGEDIEITGLELPDGTCLSTFDLFEVGLENN